MKYKRSQDIIKKNVTSKDIKNALRNIITKISEGDVELSKWLLGILIEDGKQEEDVAQGVLVLPKKAFSKLKFSSKPGEGQDSQAKKVR